MRRTFYTTVLGLIMMTGNACANKTISLGRVEAPIVVDGDLKELDGAPLKWESGFKESDRWDRKLDTLERVREDTSFTIFTDGGYLYLAVRLDEPTGAVVAEGKTPDEARRKDDTVALYIRTHQDETDFLAYTVSAGGQLMLHDYGQMGLVRAVRQTAARAACRLYDDHWTVELAIPLAELKINAKVDQWRVQVERRRAGRESGAVYSTWSPTVRAAVISPRRFGRLHIGSLDVAKFSWQMAPAASRVVKKKENLYLRRTVTLKNMTGNARTVMLRSRVSGGTDEHGAQAQSSPTTIRPDESREVNVELLLTGKETAGELLHEVLASEGEGLITLSRIEEPVSLRYEPVYLRLVDPGYRASIFATQKLETLRAVLEKRDDLLAIPTPKVTLFNMSEEEVGKGILRAHPEGWEVSVPGIKALPEGSYKLRAESRGKTLAERVIRKLPHQPGEVWIDQRGVLYRDGKPFPAFGFHYGRWDKLTPDYLPGAALNLFYPVTDRGSPNADAEKRIETLAKGGLASGITIPVPSEESRKREQLSDAEREQYRRLAHRYRENRDVILYYISDEPEIRSGLTPRLLRQVYEIFVEEDPWHPVVITNNTIEGVGAYLETADVSNPDPYPVFKEGIGASRGVNVGRFYLERIPVGREPYRAKWVTPEWFHYYWVPGTRGPTATEMRSQQVVAMMYGAVGVTGYREQGVWDNPGISSSIPYLSREFQALFPLMINGRVEPLDLGPNLEACRVEHGDGAQKGVLLMITNLKAERHTIELRHPCFAESGEWRVLGTSSTLPGGEQVTLRFTGHESLLLANANVSFPEDLDWAAVLATEQERLKLSKNEGNVAHALHGTQAIPVALPKAAAPALFLANDGMKDPRGHGLVVPDFPAGGGIELVFKTPLTLSELRLFGSNIQAGSVLAQQGDDWPLIGKITHESDAPDTTVVDQRIPLEPVRTQRIRLMPEKLNGSTWFLMEVEAYAAPESTITSKSKE